MKPLPSGIIPVVQTAFDTEGRIDETSVRSLMRDAIGAGAVGLLLPVVASEVAVLSTEERQRLLQIAMEENAGRVALIVGASSDDPAVCRTFGRLATGVGASAWLIAAPQRMYREPAGSLLAFFREAAGDIDVPLLIQDLQFDGPGLPIETMAELRRALPQLIGFKIETLPTGPKLTRAREALGGGLHLSGGWAVPQLIEALDRGVDAMIPESSMVRVYTRIFNLHRSGRRDEAVHLFRRLLPVLAFSNQDLLTSVAFFKRLLKRKGIFAGDTLRLAGFAWDRYNARIADELIDLYLALEAEVTSGAD